MTRDEALAILTAERPAWPYCNPQLQGLIIEALTTLLLPPAPGLPEIGGATPADVEAP